MLWLATPIASADETTTAEAKALFDAGSRAFDLGEYDRAIQSFESAYRLSGAPALLLNIAQAHRLAGNCGEAARFYRKFLEKQPKTPRRAEIEARRAEMEACESKPKSGADTKQTDTKLADTPPPPPPPPAAEGTDPWRIVAWSGVGLGSAGAVVTGITTVLALGKESDLADKCRSDGGCRESERSTLDAYETLRVVAIVGGVVTAIGAGAAILGFVESKPRRPEARSRFELLLGAGQIGARGAF
ncbi:MAG: tetratricopeptide repeat protein [Labilithrix sp.]